MKLIIAFFPVFLCFADSFVLSLSLKATMNLTRSEVFPPVRVGLVLLTIFWSPLHAYDRKVNRSISLQLQPSGMLLNLCNVIYTLTGTWQEALQANICYAAALENVSMLLIFLLFSAGLFSSLILGDCWEIVAIHNSVDFKPHAPYYCEQK